MEQLKYEYSPVIEDDGIRIFFLEPAESRDEELRGSLQHISLSQYYGELIEPYTALSYVWGDPTPVDRILLGDHELGIAANLSSALRDLRDVSRPLRLWADAVCINQKNIPERSRQVALMGRIFRDASNTIIYFGSLNAHLDGIIELVKQHAYLDNPKDISRNPLIYCRDKESGGYDISLVDAAYHSLLPNPWFRRIWVLQELVLSREPWVQCGNKRVRWVDLCRLLGPSIEWHRTDKGNPRHLRSNQVTDLHSMDNLRIDYWRFHTFPRSNKVSTNSSSEESSGIPGESRSDSKPSMQLNRDRPYLTLARVLRRRRNCQVSDPRDMIFAHMGIISDRRQVENFIKIDYSKTISEVFAAVGRYVCFCDGPEAMAAEVTPSPLRVMISSWAPDWGVHVDRHSLGGKTTFAHALILRVHRAAKILQLSSPLPTPSSFKRRFKFRRMTTPSWKEIVHFLHNKNKENTENMADLDSWPREIFALIQSQNRETPGLVMLYSLLVEYLLKWYTGRNCEAIAPRSRLALLNDGNVIIVPHEALVGDTVAWVCAQSLWGQKCILTVRPCEPQTTTDLIGDNLGDNLDGDIYGHASLVGICGDDVRSHFRISNPPPPPYPFQPIDTLYDLSPWAEPFMDGSSVALIFDEDSGRMAYLARMLRYLRPSTRYIDISHQAEKVGSTEARLILLSRGLPILFTLMNGERDSSA
ncbi:hypothetical protein O1611_g7544 [Lasiodiplodia mahajangana]|uniref:Uncharacterized protein n=1 Tax=Lasiodiplodia mahajangana TaxID=1108764 RepID=A0ACC2JF55_9PEZI|nr:hypothetical protein O1611_g7544 [Lasiodiplodia mahajangana]